MDVPALFAARQSVRQERDNLLLNVKEEIDTLQDQIKREGIIARRTFDMQLHELKRQLEQHNYGSPAGRIAHMDIHDKISELKFNYNQAVLDRDNRLAKSANDRCRRRSEIQLEYENAEIAICTAIRDKNGFAELGLGSQTNDSE